MRFEYKKEIFSHSKDAVADIMDAVKQTKKLADLCHFKEDEIVFLQLVTEEACYNAYEYCKKTNKDKIKVDWQTNGSEFVIAVCHEGDKFELKKKDDVNFGRRGRGLQLILNLMDDVKVESSQNYVKLVMKKILKN